ncbi:SoxR reducing system RseC family protein [Acidobacteriota bacterium]
MKDKGIVISTDEDFAQVEVDCLSACKSCAASILCLKKDQDTGLLSVRNALRAGPGDAVTIDVPDTTYSKTLIWLFSVLLGGCLIGMAMGYLASALIPLGSSESSLIGLLLGILLAGFWLSLRFRKMNSTNLYPVITAIERKGEFHE